MDEMTTGTRIGVFGCKHTTRDLILGALRNGIPVHQVISISLRKAEERQVAGYYDLRGFLEEQGIRCYPGSKYSLDSDTDKDALLSMKLDLALVAGCSA